MRIKSCRFVIKMIIKVCGLLATLDARPFFKRDWALFFFYSSHSPSGGFFSFRRVQSKKKRRIRTFFMRQTKKGQEMRPAPYMKAWPRFRYCGSCLSLPFICHYDAEAPGLIRAYSDNTPAICSHAVHFFLGFPHSIGFDFIFKHIIPPVILHSRYFLSCSFVPHPGERM